ncbi:ATP-dependent Clp protease proteolytic subunit [Amycolatopsis sp. OK19-0408]|uniref:ATP-dependent Clp protease proteolytic subunit n=1 Tax=Amycolatopsis iheyensis TaxID=2945988 RepID=A0A9X2NNN8_9PSEU|nr:ATP-dependent Clp protease proteolytic subunit [Amycolatopsis iheyensis]MCR6488445.1 ATP-dependent Clp protease proteolytic subunit [Amycolatopsis iheyensis]
MSLHSRAMDKLMSDMFDDRTVIIGGELDRSVSTSVTSQLLLLNATDPDEGVKIYIDSAAGSVSAAFAICDMITWIKPEVSTLAIGAVGSVAAMVLCSGAKGKRYALPNSDVVLRLPGPEEGFAEEPVKPTAAAHERWGEEMVQLLAERTGQRPEAVAADLRNHHRLSAAASVAYGIVDQVVVGGKFAPQSN